MIILAKLTGWGLDELLDLTPSDLKLWVSSAQKIENEIAEQAKRRR